jgi:hypothetical protein
VLVVAAGVLLVGAVADVALPSDDPFDARARGALVLSVLAAALLWFADVGGVRAVVGRFATTVDHRLPLRPIALVAIVAGVATGATVELGAVHHSPSATVRAIGGAVLWTGLLALGLRAVARRQS